MARHATTDIKSLARVHTRKALNVLAGIMDCETAAPAARVAAAQSLLDRGWGKAAQAIEISGDLTTKVIRAPLQSETAAAWSAQHVPEAHTEH